MKIKTKTCPKINYTIQTQKFVFTYFAYRCHYDDIMMTFL